MDKVIRKFFDAEGKEAPADKAVICHELITNELGGVVKDSWYFPSKKPVAEEGLRTGQKGV